jgi:hypothetical protein
MRVLIGKSLQLQLSQEVARAAAFTDLTQISERQRLLLIRQILRNTYKAFSYQIKEVMGTDTLARALRRPLHAPYDASDGDSTLRCKAVLVPPTDGTTP